MTCAAGSGVPLYRQIQDWVVTGILEGRLIEGATVPSVRQLAIEAGVNPLTVAKAYRGLQDQGVLERRRGQEALVSAGAQVRLQRQERSRFLSEQWPVLKATIQRLGLASSLASDLLSGTKLLAVDLKPL